MAGSRNTVKQVGFTLNQYKIVSAQDDYLICTKVGDPANTQLKIAKPYLLRKNPFATSGWNGLTFNYTSAQARTANSGATENQVIVPAYVAGDIIFATIPPGGTGVTSISGIVLMDINCDGRAWAKL